MLEDLQLERLETAEVILVKSIAKRILPAILNQEVRNITSTLLSEKSLRAEQVEYILVLDKQGHVLTDTYIASPLPDQLLKLENTFRKGQSYKLQKINAASVSVYNIAVPVRQGLKQLATVHLGIKKDYMRSIITPTQKASARSQTLTIIIAAIGIFVALVISKAITRPILKLTKLTEQISEGKLNTKIEVNSKDEIGKLALSFNRMIENLQKTTISIDRLHAEVADRQKAEEELDIERYQLLSMFEGMDEVVYVADPNNYELLYMNSAAKKNWGDNIGRKCHRVLHHLETPCDFCTNGIIFDENMGHSYIWEGHNKVNQRWFRCIDKAIRWSDGRMVHFEMAIDITERKQAEDERNDLIKQLKEEQGLLKQQKQKAEDSRKALKNVALDLEESKADLERQKTALEQTNKERECLEIELVESNEVLKKMYAIKSDFTSMVSHELRTPLTAIKEGIEIVLDGVVGEINAEQKDFLEMAKRNVARLKRLIDDVLDFSKLESKKLEFKMEGGNINDAINETIESQKLVAEEKGIYLKAELESHLPRMKFDSDRIIQVLTNLITNALKFTESGGISIISTYQPQEQNIKVIVRDTGPGMKEEDLSKLFEKFQQLGGMNQRKTGGSGLGLAISKEIVTQHRGKIWVESELGKGSDFIFTIPINWQYNILVIDDEKVVLDLCERILKQRGYTVSCFQNGQEGLKIAQENVPDLIILDMRLKDISGYELVGCLKSNQNTSAIPILVMSGYADEIERIENRRQEWALPWIAKPFDTKTFLAKVIGIITYVQ